MALAATLGIATFADLIKASEANLTLEYYQSRTLASGQPFYADRAPARWIADITTPPMPIADVEDLMALVDSRAGGLKPFLLYNKKMPYPRSDPTGSGFGSATPVVGSITDRLHTAFTGFPNNYVIPRGTYLQILYDTSRYYLGKFAESITANGSGAVAAVELTLPMPDLITGGAAVTVVKPAAKFVITPGTARPSKVGMHEYSIAFSAEQTSAK